MSSKPYRWLGSPSERQHVFVADRERSLCQMAVRGPDFCTRPQALWCGWCKRRLKHLREKGLIGEELPPIPP